MTATTYPKPQDAPSASALPDSSDWRALMRSAPQPYEAGSGAVQSGVFCEDYVVFPEGVDTHDPWITLALVAQATERVTLATMITPLTRRRPWSVAA